MTMTLAADHTFAFTGGASVTGHWSLEGDSLTMVADKRDGKPIPLTPEQTQILKVSEDRKTLTPPAQSPLTWQKVD